MNTKNQNAKIIFGLKLKQFRQEKKLSSSKLSSLAGMSNSYLNEIEKGKKYPKQEKIEALAEALELSVDDLTSIELTQDLSPVNDLLQSNFLNELPLDLFGIELQKVVEIIASAPARVGAFISTLLELSRNYELREENFYFGALRSYLQLHYNYFEELEKAVEKFTKQYKLPTKHQLTSTQLHILLEKKFQYEIVEGGLDKQEDLKQLRAVFVPKKRQLLLNSQLTERQRTFEFGKELGFNFLNIQQRANTSSLLRGRTFEEVLSHSQAIYFSVALLMNKERIIKDIEHFFSLEKWDPEAFIKIMKSYDATPEMFYHRLTNILPRYFDLKKIFFLRFVHDPQHDYYQVDRELHFTNTHHPHGNGINEHYCRRWIAVSLLKDLYQMQDKGQYVDTVVSAQISEYYGTDDRYLCITIARPSYPSPKHNVSVTLGFLINDNLKEKVKFLNDPAINTREVNKTCERCPITDCKERAVEPTVIIEREKRRRVQKALKKLTEK